MADQSKLDGSFSGLWVCEICGNTGEACHCEHFQRGTHAWGPDKRLTDAETAAEYWSMAFTVEALKWPVISDQRRMEVFLQQKQDLEVTLRLATIDHEPTGRKEVQRVG